ncbi:hypothetical protein NFI96_004035 [Prochilodus magdalenae]|nr:hypothetical protein NFI96_004035 [Prochilodus magdalenae]
MRAAHDEAAAAGACFTQVSRRIGRLFRRLPKSRSWSEGLRLLRRSSSSGALVLADCSYTCHLECEGLVQLDCNQRDVQTEETPTDSPCRPYSTPSPTKLLEGSRPRRLFGGFCFLIILYSAGLNSSSPLPEPTAPLPSSSVSWNLEWCRGPPEALEPPNLDPAPQMTGSNSMSSGYCSLDEESDDFTFFTAKTSFFRRPHGKQGAKNAAKEDEEANAKSLSVEEIKARIEEYNSKVSENGMKLADDGNYTGFIKVHLKLRRPVTVLSPDGSPPAEGPEKRTSFYMPSDTVKQLHVSSSNTVSEVIQGLLKKFTVQDNPGKFALYRRTHRDGQDLFQKLAGSEHPLYLRLVAGPDLENLSFVLKENETGEVEWHAFSVPELQNFLTILNKEEHERVKQVQMRYGAYKNKLLEALKEVQNKPG